MQKVISWLKLAIPFLVLAVTALRNLDTNDTGTDDKAANELDGIIARLNVFITGFSDPAKEAVATGYAQIKIFGDNVINSLKELSASNIKPELKRSEGQVLVDLLSDDTKVYQARKGKDADLLKDYKKLAQKMLDEMA